MKIHYSLRHLKLTEAIKDYVESKIGDLDHLDKDAIGAHVVLFRDEAHAAQPFHVKVHVTMPGPDVHAESKAEDLYQAIDLVVDKVGGQLRKHKSRVKDKGKVARVGKTERNGR